MSFYTSQQSHLRLNESSSAYLTQLSAAGRTRDLPVTIALAMAACSLVSLPGGNLESPEDYFLTNGGTIAAEAIEAVNEIIPVDFRTALTLAKDLFLIRYEAAQRPFQAFGYDFDNGLATVFGLNAHLPQNVVDIIAKDAREVIKHFNRLTSIIASIRKE